MNSSERGPHGGDPNRERQELIDRYRDCLDGLHRFSESVRELGPAGGDVIAGNRGLVLDMCVAIETILDHDLTRLQKPEHSEVNVEGDLYNPDDLALATIEAVKNRLQERVEALRKSAPGTKPN